MNSLRILPRAGLQRTLFRTLATTARASFSPTAFYGASAEPNAPKTVKGAPTPLGTTKRLPEFSLAGKVVLVSGAARGLGLVQAEALLEAGAFGSSHPFTSIH